MSFLERHTEKQKISEIPSGAVREKSMISKHLLWGAASVLTMLVVWKMLSMYFKSDFILPSPENTFIATAKLLAEVGFIKVVCTTVLRGVAGFVVAGVLGIGLGILSGINENFCSYIKPFLVVIRSTPVVAVILLALIWFTPNAVPVFIALLTMFPIICMNVIDGMKSVDRSLVEMAEFYRTSHAKIVREVYIPAIMPFIISGISSAVGMGWRAIIVGEVLAQPTYGIGTMMHSAQSFLNVEILIAWTLIAVLLSSLFEWIIRMCEKKIVRWRTQ